MSTIYRVTIKTTGSLQPGGGSHWTREVIYCGTDREAARTAYHGSDPLDNDRSYGSPARVTVSEAINDSETESFADDTIEEEEPPIESLQSMLKF